jgi:hypothetical protein
MDSIGAIMIRQILREFCTLDYKTKQYPLRQIVSTLAIAAGGRIFAGIPPES